jgi:hypothetical protein
MGLVVLLFDGPPVEEDFGEPDPAGRADAAGAGEVRDGAGVAGRDPADAYAGAVTPSAAAIAVAATARRRAARRAAGRRGAAARTNRSINVYPPRDSASMSTKVTGQGPVASGI